MIEKQLHKLRKFYLLRQKIDFGLSWFGAWRKRLKKSAKKQKTKNIIFESGSHHSEDQLSKITQIFGSLEYEIVGPLYEWGIDKDGFPPKPSKKSFFYNVLALPKSDF